MILTVHLLVLPKINAGHSEENRSTINWKLTGNESEDRGRNKRRETIEHLRTLSRDRSTNNDILNSPFWKQKKDKKTLKHCLTDLITDKELENFREKIRRDYLSHENSLSPL